MINHRNDVKMGKTQVEPHATGKWLKIVFYFFYNNIDSFEVLSRKVAWKISPRRKRKANFSIITSFAWFVIDYSSSPIRA